MEMKTDNRKKIRMKDIADKAGVSVVTVFNALSGKGGVSASKKAEILKLAEETGYVPESRREPEVRSRTAGILIPDRYISVGTSFYWEMYQHVAFALSGAGILSSLEILQDTVPGVPLPNCIRGNAADSLIIIGKMNRTYMERLMEHVQRGRTVLMDFFDSDYGCRAVLSDNRTGMYRATQYLIDHGHRDIGFLGTPALSRNILDRYYGYLKCLRDNGIHPNHEWILRDRTVDAEETPCIHLPETLPSAFACSSDYSAGFLYDALETIGRSVPEDISLVSYDDYLYDHPLGKKLTTYHVDMEGMAREAVRILQEKDDDSPEVVYVDSYLVERESVRLC